MPVSITATLTPRPDSPSSLCATSAPVMASAVTRSATAPGCPSTCWSGDLHHGIHRLHSRQRTQLGDVACGRAHREPVPELAEMSPLRVANACARGRGVKTGFLAFERRDGGAVDRGRTRQFDEPGTRRFVLERRHRLCGLRVRHHGREKKTRTDDSNTAHGHLRLACGREYRRANCRSLHLRCRDPQHPTRQTMCNPRLAPPVASAATASPSQCESHRNPAA